MIEYAPLRIRPYNLFNLCIYSDSLDGRGDVSLYLPPEFEKESDLPLVVLLHGVYGSHWSWILQGNAHIIAEELIRAKKIKPLAIAMPSDGLMGNGSGYISRERNVEKWIVKDVTCALIKIFEPITVNSPKFISGLSMGGFGALYLGAKYSEEYSAVSAHSSIISLKDFEQFIPQNEIDQLEIFLDFDLIDTIETRSHMNNIRFDCGNQDLLFDSNQAFSTKLNELNIEHTFKKYGGTHNWDYWSKNLTHSLTFFSRCLTQSGHRSK